MSNSSDEQPSLIQYARFHGLAYNHLSEDIYECFPSDTISCDEDEALPELKIPFLEKLPAEPKFRLNSKAASLLASSVRPPPAPNWSDMLSDHRQVKSLKIEQPFLKSDHDNDMRKIRFRKLHRIKHMNIVPLEVDEEKDEPPAWSLFPKEVAAFCDKKIAEERLQTTRGVLKALQNALRPIYTAQMHEEIIAEDLAFVKRKRVESLSRKLSSSEFGQEIFTPLSDSPRKSLLCEVPGVDCGQSQTLDEDVFKKSFKINDYVDRTEGLLQFAKQNEHTDGKDTIDTNKQVSVSQEQHPKVLKREQCNTETSIHTSGHKTPDAKRISFASDFMNPFPKHKETDRPGSYEADKLSENGHPTGVTCQEAQPVGIHVLREMSEREKTAVRVKVPKLDGSMPAAPINAFLSTEFLHAIITDNMLQKISNFNEDDQTMDWQPIPSANLSSVFREDIESPPRLKDWTSQPAFATMSADLLWRPDVLRVLNVNEESDEEELQEDLSLKDEPVWSSESSSKRPVPMNLVQPLQRKKRQHLSIPEAQLTTFGFGSLAGFMDTRKAYKKPRLEPEGEQGRLVKSDAATSIIDDVQVPATPTNVPTFEVAIQHAPHVSEITASRTVIFKSSLLKSHRRLTQALETRPDPPLIIVYRDLDSEADADAQPDMIIAPTIAAILTTLQATTQRSLPGQGYSHPAIFNRILGLSQLYEQLLVITTLPSTDFQNLSLPVMCSQISTLTSFCASVSDPQSDSIVQPFLVPIPPSPFTILTETAQGPSDPLYTWIHALILKHVLGPTSASPCSSPHSPILLPEETLWELFLCRAGMNPYAAQMVLGMLKKPESTRHPDGQTHQGDEQETLWGLGAFVQMSREKRIETFGSVVGVRAVERVSDVLDMAWGGIRGSFRDCV